MRITCRRNKSCQCHLIGVCSYGGSRGRNKHLYSLCWSL
jgi:hypothetical protein